MQLSSGRSVVIEGVNTCVNYIITLNSLKKKSSNGIFDHFSELRVD